MARVKASPVVVSQLHPELQKLVKQHGADTIQIIDKNTVVVWNSAGAKTRLSRRVK